MAVAYLILKYCALAVLNFSLFMEPESSLPCSPGSTTVAYPKPHESSPRTFFKTYFNIIIMN
jgi:hypothetical protein